MVITICLLMILTPTSYSENYVTWPSMEYDKCASAWLIKRFVDTDARFSFIPQGEFATDGIPFDTPDAEFRRYHNLSTFEYILNKFNLGDNPALLSIGKIMHLIEINSWYGKKTEELKKFTGGLKGIINKNMDSPDQCLKEAFKFLDIFYQDTEENIAINKNSRVEL